MPGASANGSFAYTAISKVANAETITVTVKTAPSFMPAAAKIAGFTAKIYAIIKNVVSPAITSVFTLCSFELNPNTLSRKDFFFIKYSFSEYKDNKNLTYN